MNLPQKSPDPAFCPGVDFLDSPLRKFEDPNIPETRRRLRPRSCTRAAAPRTASTGQRHACTRPGRSCSRAFAESPQPTANPTCTELGNSKIMEAQGWSCRGTVPARRNGQHGALQRMAWGVLAVGLAQVSVAAAGEGVPNWGALVRSTEVLPRDGHTRGRSVWTSLDRPLRGGYCEKTPLATPKVRAAQRDRYHPNPSFQRKGAGAGSLALQVTGLCAQAFASCRDQHHEALLLSRLRASGGAVSFPETAKWVKAQTSMLMCG